MYEVLYAVLQAWIELKLLKFSFNYGVYFQRFEILGKKYRQN